MNGPAHTSPKMPPYSIDAEQWVLGGLILSNGALDEIEDLLPEHFYRRDNQLIYAAATSLIRSGKRCDFVTLCEYLGNQGTLEEAGGAHYVGTITNNTTTAANVKGHAALVRDKATLRRLIAVAGNIAELGYRPEGRDMQALLAAAQGEVQEVQDSAVGEGGPRLLEYFVDQAEARIEAAHKRGKAVSGLSTGLTDLDEMTTGLHPGELIVVGGRPSHGKSTLALNVSEHVAETQGPVLFFSLEMPGEQLAMRSISSSGRGIDLQRLRRGNLDEIDFGNLVEAGMRLGELPIYIDDQAGLSPAQVRARTRRLHRTAPLSLVVVDFLQQMQAPGDNRTNQIGACSRALKQLAKDLSLPVLAVCSLNRACEARDNKRPRMSDIRESGDIESDADLVLFTYTDTVYDKKSRYHGTTELLIEKQRNGPLGMVRVAFDGSLSRFRNLAPNWEADPVPEQKKAKRGHRATTEPPPDRRVPD